MKKILALILIIGTLAFSKESVSYTHAYVTHSEAIYEYRNNRVYDDYYEEDNYYRSDYNRYSEANTNTNNIGLDTIVGGTIGVIIGNQIGKGNGRTAAKIVGGLLGASVANHNRYEANNYNYVKHPNKKRHYRNHREKVLVGYRNYFVFENRQYSKVTNRAKKRIKIRKTINF